MKKLIFDIAIDFYLLYDFYRDSITERESRLYSELDYKPYSYRISSNLLYDRLNLILENWGGSICITINFGDKSEILSILVENHLFKIDFDSYQIVDYYHYDSKKYRFDRIELPSLPISIFKFKEYEPLLILEGLPRIEYEIEVESK